MNQSSISPVFSPRMIMTRHGFLTLFIMAVGGLATLVVAIPIIGYVLSPLIQAPPEIWRDMGSVDAIPIGKTVERTFQADYSEPWSGSTSKQGVWLRRTGPDTFIAFALYCTHLGCPVHWLQQPQIFLCPCHGSVFNSDGTVAGGPAPRPLFRYETRVVNGHVQIKTRPLPVVT